MVQLFPSSWDDARDSSPRKLLSAALRTRRHIRDGGDVVEPLRLVGLSCHNMIKRAPEIQNGGEGERRGQGDVLAVLICDGVIDPYGVVTVFTIRVINVLHYSPAQNYEATFSRTREVPCTQRKWWLWKKKTDLVEIYPAMYISHRDGSISNRRIARCLHPSP